MSVSMILFFFIIIWIRVLQKINQGVRITDVSIQNKFTTSHDQVIQLDPHSGVQ